jgi:hypothetical protein
MNLLAIAVRPGVAVNGDVEPVALSGLLKRLWQDDCGALLAVEWVLIATLLVLGLVPGLIAVRQGLLSELTETANATMALDQSYGFTGQRIGCSDAAVGGGTLDRNGNRTNRVNPVIEQAVRIGAVDGRNVRGEGNGNNRNGDHRTGDLAQGGTQAFSAGSSFIEGRHFGGKSISLKSTAPNASDANQKPCD